MSHKITRIARIVVTQNEDEIRQEGSTLYIPPKYEQAGIEIMRDPEFLKTCEALRVLVVRDE